MMLDVGDQLHGPYFGGSAQCAGGEGIDVGLYRVAIGVDLAAHTGYEVDDVAVVLYLLIEIHLHVVGVPAEVVAGEVYQHHVLGVLLGVGKQGLGTLLVYLDITGTESGPGDRVDAGVSARYLAMRLGGRAEDTETSEIEIEQIRRGVDAAKSPVHLEVVSLERLLEATAQYDLEDISPEAVLDALADHRLVFLAGDRGGLGTRCLEVIGGEVTVLYQCLDFFQPASLVLLEHLH